MSTTNPRRAKGFPVSEIPKKTKKLQMRGKRSNFDK